MSDREEYLYVTTEDIRKAIVDALGIPEGSGYKIPKVRNSIQPVFLYNVCPEPQPALAGNVAAVQNVEYDLFTVNGLSLPQRDVRLIDIYLNMGTANEAVQCIIDFDTDTVTASLTMDFGDWYQVATAKGADMSSDQWGMEKTWQYKAFLYESRVINSLKVKKTTNNGAGVLYYKVIWAKY